MYLGYRRSLSGSAYAQPRDSSKHYGHWPKPSRNGRPVGSGHEAGSPSSPSCSSTFLAAAAAAAVVKEYLQSHFPGRILCN